MDSMRYSQAPLTAMIRELKPSVRSPLGVSRPRLSTRKSLAKSSAQPASRACCDELSKTFTSEPLKTRDGAGEEEFSDFPSLVFSGKFSTRIALVDGVSGRELTFEEVVENSVRLASGLRKLGVEPGDVVMILAPNSIYYPVAFLAISCCGALAATPNPLGTPEDVRHQVKLTSVKLAITTRELVFKIQSLSLPTIIIDCDDDLLQENDAGEGNEDVVLLSRILRAPDEEANGLRRGEVSSDDPAAVLYSSGTTGMSKAVVLSHRNIIAQILQLTNSLNRPDESIAPEEEEVHLCALPMSHIFGSVVIALQQLHRGNKTVVLRGFELSGILSAIEHHRVSHIYAVPPVILALTKLLQKSNSLANRLSSLRSVMCGAAPLGKELIASFHSLLPSVRFIQIYGLTEVTGALTLNRLAIQNPASVGVLLPGMEARVVDVESGKPLPPYQHGELIVRGPTTMIGYMNDPRATSLVLDSKGWLRTGDLVYFDEQGNLYVVDRIKELIKYNALQVAPAELEALLLSHPLILDAAVVPYKSQEAGEIPMAFVVPSSDGSLTEDDVKAFVAEHVAPYKRVRRVAFTNVIPKTATGKILRKEIVKQVLHA